MQTYSLELFFCGSRGTSRALLRCSLGHIPLVCSLRCASCKTRPVAPITHKNISPLAGHPGPCCDARSVTYLIVCSLRCASCKTRPVAPITHKNISPLVGHLGPCCDALDAPSDLSDLSDSRPHTLSQYLAARLPKSPKTSQTLPILPTKAAINRTARLPRRSVTKPDVPRDGL